MKGDIFLDIGHRNYLKNQPFQLESYHLHGPSITCNAKANVLNKVIAKRSVSADNPQLSFSAFESEVATLNKSSHFVLTSG